MRGNLFLRAFLPLAAYGILTELALWGLSGISAAVSQSWSWAAFLEWNTVLPWANAAAGLAAAALFWKWYDREEEKGGDRKQRRNARREPGRFLLLMILGICCCLGGSGLIFLLGNALAGVSAFGTGAAAEAVGSEIQPASVRVFSLMTAFLCTGCIIPFVEEFLFRRALYGTLREEKHLGCLGAVLMSSVLFGLYHGRLLQGIYAGLLGLLLACLYQCTGTLASSVIVHAAANSSAVLLEMVHYGKWLAGSRTVLLFQTGTALLLAAVILLCLCKKRN